MFPVRIFSNTSAILIFFVTFLNPARKFREFFLITLQLLPSTYSPVQLSSIYPDIRIWHTDRIVKLAINEKKYLPSCMKHWCCLSSVTDIFKNLGCFSRNLVISYLPALSLNSGNTGECVNNISGPGLSETPDDGQRRCPKHVEFYNRIKLE